MGHSGIYQIGKRGSLPIEPMAGQRFGKLVMTGERRQIISSGGNARSQWECKCDCGTDRKWVGYANLSCGRTISCGCMRGNPQLPDEAARRRAYKHYGYKATARGISFDLLRDEFYALILEPCHYCGSLPNKRMHAATAGSGKEGLVCNGIDRVDNDIGYTFENSVACCSMCNWMKNTTSYTDWIAQMDKILTHSKKRTTHRN